MGPAPEGGPFFTLAFSFSFKAFIFFVHKPSSQAWGFSARWEASQVWVRFQWSDQCGDGGYFNLSILLVFYFHFKGFTEILSRYRITCAKCEVLWPFSLHSSKCKNEHRNWTINSKCFELERAFRYALYAFKKQRFEKVFI